MRRATFFTDVEPASVFERAKDLLKADGFKVTSEEIRPGFWDLHARKASMERLATGRVRDVDVIVAGARGRFEVQLDVGFWGRDIMIPAVEAILTGGTSSGPFVSAHRVERDLWEKLVGRVDPSLRVCPADGLVFDNDLELRSHLESHGEEETTS